MSGPAGHIVFGLGAGRSGTVSLAVLLDAQPNTVCFHEINPSAMAWEGAEGTVISLLRDFRAILSGDERALTIDRTSPDRDAPIERMMALERVTGIGDVGHYYLPYVETILVRAPQARFPCLRRDRDAVVQSFTAKLRLRPHSRTTRLRALFKGIPLPQSRNHWAGSGDTRWQEHERFDACFPSYEGLGAADLATHLQRWHDDYYAEADRLAALHPNHVRVFDLDCLNNTKGRRALLEFALPGAETDPDVAVHANSRAVTR